jgi:hypothetical protein
MNTAGSGERRKTRNRGPSALYCARQVADGGRLTRYLGVLRGDEPFQRFDNQRMIVLLG